MLEAVFHGGAGVLTQKTARSAQRDLRRDHTRQQHKRCPEPGGGSLHSHVDNAPQYKRKGDAGNTQHRLYCDQNAYQKLGFSRYDAEPL